MLPISLVWHSASAVLVDAISIFRHLGGSEMDGCIVLLPLAQQRPRSRPTVAMAENRIFLRSEIALMVGLPRGCWPHTGRLDHSPRRGVIAIRLR